MPEQFALQLVDSHMLAANVRHMVFRRGDGQPLILKPGQYLKFQLDADGESVGRSFSVATPFAAESDAVDEIAIAVSFVDGGVATRELGGMQPGTQVTASGPYGRLTLDTGDSNARYVIVTTGTGIVPFRAMRPRLAAVMAERDVEIVLLHGVRGPDELLYGEEFAAFADNHTRFRYMPCFSRQSRTQPGPDEHDGHVQDQLDAIAPDPTTDIAYLCGHPDMIDSTHTALKEAGFSRRWIRAEKFSYSH